MERLFQLVEKRLAPDVAAVAAVAAVADPAVDAPVSYDAEPEVVTLGARATHAHSGRAPLPTLHLPPVQWTPGQSLGRLPY